ncbi:MAG: threonine--tRNA ligase [Acidobacteriota bacterium]
MGKETLGIISRDGVLSEIPKLDDMLNLLRHSTAHLMALAVTELYPDVELGIGPATSDGFYYDFKTSHSFTEEDLAVIEKKMKKLAGANIPFKPFILSKDEAVELFNERNEQLKIELIRDREDETLSCYSLGKLVDFCLGPHVASTKELKVFKLLSVAGAYWKGDETRDQMQRIYGTAFFNRDDLQEYLRRQEEAKKRDHRKLGRALNLFSIDETVAPGLIFWHPDGATLRNLVENFLREELEKNGYQFVVTPHIAKSDLWKTSGHYSYFRENMYTLPMDEEEYVLKPMNCPGHILIYKSDIRSYRDLPIRYAEFGTVYRYEKSGTLHGMLRVRGFTQDDAHIFCTEEQVADEVVSTLDLAEHILNSFGFDDFSVTLSVWDPESPKAYAGEPEDWAMAEKVLIDVLDKKGWTYKREAGEAAFYGPKIDIHLIDALGRSWQLSTFQFDFNLPGRFGVNYIGSDSKPHNVIMIHRALLGSLERFIGILTEHYAGAFPVWLAPFQTVVLPISDKHHDYASEIESRLTAAGIRCKSDLRNEKIGYKIREAQVKKVPFMLIVGDKEKEAGNISVRSRTGGDLGSSSLEEFINQVREMVDSKAVIP